MKYIYLNCIIVLSATTSISAFSVSQQSQFAISNRMICRQRAETALSMGLFDGVKGAFSAPPSSAIDSERETPIDRWMGWNVKPMDDASQQGPIQDDGFVDSMDAVNYVTASIAKPMGIVFEENDEEFGGIFVLSLNEGGVAEQDGNIKPGDQLVAVNDVNVNGFKFDPALNEIIKSEGEQTKLTLFRGTQEQLYGPTGASQEWLEEFISK